LIHVLLAVGEEVVAGRVAEQDVAGMEPAVAAHTAVGLVVLVVAIHDDRAAHDLLARFTVGYVLAFIVDQTHVGGYRGDAAHPAAVLVGHLLPTVHAATGQQRGCQFAEPLHRKEARRRRRLLPSIDH
jgi:hypothetical protein